MAHIEVTEGDHEGARFDLEPGHRFMIGRGEGREVDLVASDDGTLSRQAVALQLTPRRSLDVVSLQSAGSVSVYREDGSLAAVLRQGERALLRGETLDIVVYGGSGTLCAVRFVSTSVAPQARPASGPERTTRRLNVWEVLQPAPGSEWLSVVGLSAVLTRTVKRRNRFGQPMRKELSRMCCAWFGLDHVSAGQLTTWLDKGLGAFGLEVDGDKTGVLGDFIVSSSVLSSRELDLIDEELERRRGA